MSTASYGAVSTPIRRAVMEKQLRPELQEVVDNIMALRRMAMNDHFSTHRSQRDLLAKLNSEDLAMVARALEAEEAKQKPLYNRSK